VIKNEQAPTAMNQHVTMEELLEVVFSVVCAMVLAMQWHSTHVSAATVNYNNTKVVSYVAHAKGL
jgi:hypothetical protein